jgi:hypothetical protein
MHVFKLDWKECAVLEYCRSILQLFKDIRPSENVGAFHIYVLSYLAQRKNQRERGI